MWRYFWEHRILSPDTFGKQIVHPVWSFHGFGHTNHLPLRKKVHLIKIYFTKHDNKFAVKMCQSHIHEVILSTIVYFPRVYDWISWVDTSSIGGICKISWKRSQQTNKQTHCSFIKTHNHPSSIFHKGFSTDAICLSLFDDWRKTAKQKVFSTYTDSWLDQQGWAGVAGISSGTYHQFRGKLDSIWLTDSGCWCVKSMGLIR